MINIVITLVITTYPRLLTTQVALVTLVNLCVVSIYFMKSIVKVIHHSFFVKAPAKEILLQLGCMHSQ